MNSAVRKTRLAPKKVDSPLAKYNSAGQLSCIICTQPIKNDLLWVAHINGKIHRENLEKAKRTKQLPSQVVAGFKRPAEIPAARGILKKPCIVEPVKSILKNAAPEKPEEDDSVSESSVAQTSRSSEVPSDFFDAKPKQDDAEEPVAVLPKSTRMESAEEKEPEKPTAAELIPEGFFDDPQKDAKARHVEYKDPLDEEFAKFQRTIQEASAESSALVEADEEFEAGERQLEEIDEQLRHWSRVIALEKKKEDLNVGTMVKFEPDEEKPESDEDDEDFEETDFIDWRSKCPKNRTA